MDDDPAKLWSYHLQLVRIEEAFRNRKGDLAIRPIFHQLESRVEAHILVCASDCSGFGRMEDGCGRDLGSSWVGAAVAFNDNSPLRQAVVPLAAPAA